MHAALGIFAKRMAEWVDALDFFVELLGIGDAKWF